MKKNSLLILCSLFCSFAFAQTPLQQRGLYVNGFIKFRDTNVNGANLVVDQSGSILGVDIDNDGVFEKEVVRRE